MSENWINEFAEMDVGGGAFIPVANGFKYIFTVNLTEKPEKVQKEWQGKKAGYKFQWKVRFLKMEVQNQAYVDVLGTENPEKLKKISDFEENTDAILELAPTHSKILSIFILENKCNEKTKISVYRTGASNKTEYHFAIEK